MARQIDRRQRVRGGHVGSCPLNSLNGKHGLAHVVLTDCLGNLKSLPNYVLKVRVHEGMRAQPVAKEKPRWSGVSSTGTLQGAAGACPQSSGPASIGRMSPSALSMALSIHLSRSLGARRWTESMARS